ncbi:acyltransferase family protein [Bacillus sp. SCS-153A]|uniref:acyltransferase family protein n=1 Tax=Rossellomorea sedimentorum TaxID=3115294 RepID=UPI0039058B86
MEQEQMKQVKTKRVYSLDMLRGIIVVLSVFVSTIPYGEIDYSYFRHAEWYGVTITDIVLPSFITIFGTSMAIAYQKGVKWEKILKRTVRLIVYGIIFTIIVSWSIDFSTIRLTGVLQMFALLGIITVVITKFIKKPLYLMLVALCISVVYGSILMLTGQSCENGLPQPDCNISGVIDGAVFGDRHIYHQGERGFDPEGLVTSFSALSNVLFGYAFGRLILNRKETGAWKELLVIGLLLVVCSLIWDQFLPYNKRIWTPAFALLAAGSTAGMLSILYVIFDKRKQDAKEPALKPVVWFLEAFGRNSFLVYFGKFIIYSVLLHITVTTAEGELSLSKVLVQRVEAFSPYPQLTYAFIMVGFWTAVAVLLHRKKWYLKV